MRSLDQYSCERSKPALPEDALTSERSCLPFNLRQAANCGLEIFTHPFSALLRNPAFALSVWRFVHGTERYFGRPRGLNCMSPTQYKLRLSL